MSDPHERSLLSWYTQQAPMTRLGNHGTLAHSDTHADLAERVQALLIHPFHAHRYGVTPNADTERQLQNRSNEQVLGDLLTIDPRPVGTPREPGKRTFGNCRHFATLLTGLLRERGIPARSRCGFGTYFTPGKYEDHWVTEMWNDPEARWQLIDPQIDDVQRAGMGITADTLDLGREDFWVAGQAWLRCRRGERQAEDFGILDMWGLWFIRDNLVRDLAALCKIELLPWDSWGIMLKEMNDLDESDRELLDRVAETTTAPVPDAGALRELHDGTDALRVPTTIFSFRPSPAPVEIGDLARP